MKRLLTLSLAVLLTFPVLAATAKLLPSQPGRLARLMKQYQAARGGIGATAVTDARSARIALFPAAGSVRGANGEFFRSDVTLANFNPTTAQKVIAFWLQNNVNTDDPPAAELTLDRRYQTYLDFVGTVLQRTNELGSILVVPINETGEIDYAGASLDGFSRIWTNQPGAQGTVAQPFEAVDPQSWYVFETASVMGLRHDAGFRTNYGLVNIDDHPLNFTVRFIGETVTEERTITIPPLGMVHQGIPAGNYGHLVIEASVDDPEALWVVYGTSNDNITGDGWVSIGGGIMSPADLDEIDGGG